MSEALRQLNKEHADFSRLLDLLDRQLAVFAAGDRPDYDLVRAVIDYCLDYPDAVHHPKEDLIYQVLKSRDAELARVVGDLEEEHRQIGVMTGELAEAMRQVLAEELVDRQSVHDLTRKFVHLYRHHIAREEDRVFPAAEQVLSQEDWAEIDARLELRDDPLFGDAVVDRFRALRANIDGLAVIAREA
ncbi:MAG: hemerythrin domain-containing protein [Alphaproteobacteria bacterium]|nr:hemerythrin domain-containing protein [Alphaproteobacteria bacterium]